MQVRTNSVGLYVCTTCDNEYIMCIEDNGLIHLETSAKSSHNVLQLFKEIGIVCTHLNIFAHVDNETHLHMYS
jgi:hypothetical protein